MNHVLSLCWQYGIGTVAKVKRRWKKNSLSIRRFFLVILALSTLAWFGFHSSTKSLLPSAPAVPKNIVASSNISDVSQTNPLFASSPAWSQDFTARTSGKLDPKYWNVLIGPAQNSNNEQQYYTDDTANLRIENGALHLIATHEQQPNGFKYKSARLETQGKKAFLYGRVDISAKLPIGVGTWPAVWMLPDNNKYADKSPDSDLLRYKNGGEIDILEAVGFEPGVVYGVAHTASDASVRSDGTGSFKAVRVPDSSTQFNTYTLLWTPTQVMFAVNGKTYFTYTRQDGSDYTTWPFDQPFYLVANLALGGTWGGMDTAHFPGNGIDDAALPASLDIQSIHYYPYIGSKKAE